MVWAVHTGVALALWAFATLLFADCGQSLRRAATSGGLLLLALIAVGYVVG